ncbi:MAG: type I restriction endonuclease subunit R [Sphingobacteriales bacterium]|nr:type I restriction endonuclease subunit R [Sphingobacteriales bacterium]
MDKYYIVAENPESTVVAEYQTPYIRETAYQTEDQLEKAFIQLLQGQAYDYLTITSEAALTNNLRLQLQKLNNYIFSDKEWDHFFKSKIANPNSGIEEKTSLIQEDHIQILDCDDGTKKNIYLLDKTNIHNNQLQVINQYEVADGQRPNRYDVTILVNGLPLVHIELKKRGVDIKEAFNQINRYNRESFWSGSGLFEYVQLFVISNGTYTKYYSNTTRFSHIKEQTQRAAANKKRTSNSFEFTSWWADANNRPITDLMDFGRTFFAKHTLLNILCKYCVFISDKLLLAMRPYQIVATERILGRINVANNYKSYGSVDAGGYIWHTTGSGKTLTSFKTAQLASKLPFINKVLFVVDRKDLDYQTMKEYDKFEKGAANSNTNTSILKKQLSDPKANIIITTIQKLSILIKKEKNHLAFNQPIVIIFDECHRSQFGDMHKAITKAFKKYFLFGFTGTPIFAINASSSNKPDLKTTEQAFGQKLHTYTIVDAINDKNVLPFRIDYIRTMKEQEEIKDEKVWDIDREKALAAPQRVSNVVNYILEHFDQKTKRNSKPYSFTSLKNIYEVVSAKDRNKIEEVKQKIRLTGFNSIFAVSSIDFAKLYYNEFKTQQSSLPELQRLKVATIFSFGVNDDDEDGLPDENSEGTDGLSVSDRDFLEKAISDYNQIFKTNYDTSTEKFQNYYKDVSLRMKNREIDLLIVVNMFLTGFDATTLNTLWVDKNLRLHGLLQAYSRTNRILNSVKTFGNIVCFRNLEKATNESIALFGDKEAGGIVLLKTFDEYYNGYKDGEKTYPGYVSLINELTAKFPVGEQIIGEQNQKAFIRLYGSILKAKNILTTFDEFAGREILSERDVQDYHSMYINLYHEFRNRNTGDAENVNDDIVFEMELIKQVEINIDYILELIRKYHEGHLRDKEIIISINKAIDSSVELRNKKDLIEKFIQSLTPGSKVTDDWESFVEQKKLEELDQIIVEEELDKEETYKFIHNAFRDGYVQTTGTGLAKILPPVSRFTPTGERTQKRESVIEKIKAFFNRFWDISGGMLE